MRDISSHATPSGSPGGQHRPTSATFRRALISHPDEMAQTIIELHCIIRNEHDLLRLLRRTGQVAVRCIPGAHWVSVTAQLDGAPFTVAHTDERALRFDEDQYALDDGPGLRAMRTYELTSTSYADVVRQWPTLARTAAGIGSIIVAPLSGMPSPVGSVNIYSATDFSLDIQTRDFLAVLEEYVNRGMADYAALHSADMLAANLREAIRSRAPIEQAKGILMAVHQIGEDEAFRMLQVQSQNHNTKLREVARNFVAAHTRHPALAPPEPAGTGSLSDFHSAFDHAPIAMAITTLEGRLLLVNPALEEMLERPASALLHQRLDDYLHPDGFGGAHAGLADLHRGSGKKLREHYQLQQTGGRTMHVLGSVAIIFDGDGEPSHLVVHIEDREAQVHL